MIKKPDRHFFLIGVFAFLVFPLAVQAQGRSSVSGFVYGPNRERLENVQVELNSDFGSTIAHTRTDNSGRFLFLRVPFGRLSVRALPIGTDLADQTQQIEIGSIGVRGQRLADSIQLDFYLRPRRSPARVTTGVVFAQAVPDEAEKRYKLALNALENKRQAEAIQELKGAVEIFPEYFAALERLGNEYMKLQKYEEARDTFTRALTVNSRSFQSLYGLAYANSALGKFDEAVEASNKALIENKSSVQTLFLLGVTQRKVKKFDEAEKSLLQAKKIDEGRTPEIHWHLALLYAHNLKRYPKAADELELYLKSDPNNPNAENIRKLIKRLRDNLPLN
jgi:tetratricopeptide (TPR) repeat protein